MNNDDDNKKIDYININNNNNNNENNINDNHDNHNDKKLEKSNCVNILIFLIINYYCCNHSSLDCTEKAGTNL